MMETPATETAPVIEPATPETPEPAASIADHAEQFSPERADREPANTGQFANRPPEARHKAQSHRATPEDVAEINRLTKELREAEQRLGEKDPDAKLSPRVRTLKRQLAALKALEAPAPTTPVIAETKPAIADKDFTDKEPEPEDFADQPDPIRAWMKAQIQWEKKRDAHEASKQNAEQSAKAEQAQLEQAHDRRMTEFSKTKADFATVTAPFMSRELGPVMLHAIARDDNGPVYVYHLAQHPDLADELILQSMGLPPNLTSVALVQRRLKSVIASAQAAQVPDRPPQTPAYIPPKPPNPVRTGPIKTAEDPPGETASIADHAKYFGPKR